MPVKTSTKSRKGDPALRQPHSTPQTIEVRWGSVPIQYQAQCNRKRCTWLGNMRSNMALAQYLARQHETEKH